MKSLGILALIVLMTSPSLSFAWGPPRSGIGARPSPPGLVIPGNFRRLPFGLVPNRALVRSPLFFSPGLYGFYYRPYSWYPPYGYANAYPVYTYPPYPYTALPPMTGAETAYDHGYSEGYARGYEQAQKDLNRNTVEPKNTPNDEQEKVGGKGEAQ